MAGNSIGHIFRLTSFGESHGTAIGGVIDGCPAGLKLDLEMVQKALDRRRPGQSEITTQRKESDQVEFLSGILDGTTLGTPIGFTLKNEDQKSKDYDKLAKVYRPSHADYTYEEKYGLRDVRGGGRSSARETACRVVAGAIAQQLLAKEGISIKGFVSQIGHLILDKNYDELELNGIDDSLVRCPDPELSEQMVNLIKEVRADGDSVGGLVSCVVIGTPTGLGEPVFDKLHADLGKAMLGINAVKGFEIGSGFGAVSMWGSEHNDEFTMESGTMETRTNYSGGIQGGISNGQDIYFNVAFKPVATIMRDQKTVDTEGKDIDFNAEGRHDPCVVPRAVPIVEAMTALVLADHLLRNRGSKV